VTGAKQINYEMERRENGLFDMISGQQGLNDEDTDVSDKVKFFWR
jgi:hypothetical protein